LPGGSPGGMPFPAAFKYESRGYFYVIHRSKIIKIKLPSGVRGINGPYNAVNWDARKAIVFSRVRPYEVALGAPHHYVPLPSPASIGFSLDSVPGDKIVLADGSICIPLKQSLIHGKRMLCGTLVLDRDNLQWKLWDTLNVFGASYGGRYVAYSWGNEPVAHIAKVNGSWR